jgi:L-seryl-tRNA(Ser) seleniumtransferase
MTPFRVIPSIEQLLQREAVRAASDRHGRDAVALAARRAASELREMLSPRAAGAPVPSTAADALAWLEARTLALASAHARPSLRRVINATGIILHTNLGRAPLAAAAMAHARLAEGYSNLEYDLERGDRGHRHAHAERLLTTLTGAEAALVTNNTAAAALLALAALAAGREVIVSRGELVEIGGGFRVPEVLAQSGAQLREVGTTTAPARLTTPPPSAAAPRSSRASIHPTSAWTASPNGRRWAIWFPSPASSASLIATWGAAGSARMTPPPRSPRTDRAREPRSGADRVVLRRQAWADRRPARARPAISSIGCARIR